MFLTAWNWFLSNIFSKPAWFLALMVFIGCLLIKKPLYEAFASFAKALVGYMIFSVASSGMVATFRPILFALNGRFNLAAVVIDPYFGAAPLTKSITEVAGRTMSIATMAMIIGFALNIALVYFKKVTKVRSLMVGGHVMNLGAWGVIAYIVLMIPGISDLGAIIGGGLLCGLMWGVLSNLTVEPTQELTDGANIAIGHAQMTGIYLFDKLSTWIGNMDKKKGKELKKVGEIKLPGFLSIMNDTTVAASVVMLLFFGGLMLIIGKEYMLTVDESLATQVWGFYLIEKCLTFVVYLNIIILGIKMFVGELTEAFTGISQKILRGAIPAVDIAATFGFTEGSVVTLGFLFGGLGTMIAIVLSVLLKSPILAIVGFVPMFFDNGGIATFANNKGGLKAVIISTLIVGMVHVFGGGMFAYYYGFSNFGGAAANFDIAAWHTLLGVIMKNLGVIGIALICLVLILIPQIQYLKNKDTYFLVVENFEKYKEVIAKKASAKLAAKKAQK
jgi:PTS system ascorbate-specific IIC component